MYKETHIHPVEKAGVLESSLRYKLHNPKKILQTYIKSGITVLDLGCGPGFFTIEIARLLNDSGKVIAADLQNGMLEKLRLKIKDTYLEQIIQIHKCQEKSINLTDKVDFILAFYTFHEMRYLINIIDEIKLFLQPGGVIFIAEQKFHVSKSRFNEIINIMITKGFEIADRPKVFLSRAVIMKINVTK